MQYMNNKKRNLVLWGAIANLVSCLASFVISILVICEVKGLEKYLDFISLTGFSTNLWYAIIVFAGGLIATVLLLYSIREKGKHFRSSYGIFIAGFVMVLVFGGFLAWALLLGSMWVPDVIVMNTPREVRQEEEVVENRAYEEKKRKIEELKSLRDNGIISEEEYKERLFELL